MKIGLSPNRYIAERCEAKVIGEGLYIPGLKAGVFRPSPLPGEIDED